MIKELEINSTITQTQINELFNKIRVKLDEKEKELLDKLVEIEKYKKKQLELQKEELEFGIESIIGSCQMIESSLLLPKSDIQLLLMKNLYCARLDYLLNNYWRIEPRCHTLIEFSICEIEEESIHSNIPYIATLESNEISADKCIIVRDENQKIYKNEEFKFEIISYSTEGKKMKTGGSEQNFEIIIEGELESNGNEWEIQDLKNGKYEVKITIEEEGKYLIFVQYNDINIFSSPFQIEVLSMRPRTYEGGNKLKLILESRGDENWQLQHPKGMKLDSKRNIIISDYSNHRIQILDSELNFISTFGSEGKENGQFINPFGIAINSKGNIIVSDNGNHRIQIFDAEGEFISTFGERGEGDGQFINPKGICVDSNDNIYVTSNHKVQKFNSEGVFILTFGFFGTKNGYFKKPYGIGINSKGNVIVSDSENHRIQIFDSEGKFLSKFGSEGSENGQFNYPYGICIDVSDNILVCDNKNQRIQIFKLNGVFLTQFKRNRPSGITIDQFTQNLVVCSSNKISIY